MAVENPPRDIKLYYLLILQMHFLLEIGGIGELLVYWDLDTHKQKHTFGTFHQYVQNSRLGINQSATKNTRIPVEETMATYHCSSHNPSLISLLLEQIPVT